MAGRIDHIWLNYKPGASHGTMNTLTEGTQGSCWYAEHVLRVPHHPLLWHYDWGYRRDNSDSEAKPTWHTDHLVILTSGSWGKCSYVIHQQWPLPLVMIHRSPLGYCEENHCHSKPNRQHVHVAMMYMLHTNIPWYTVLRYCVWEAVHVAL